jgi:hypothetical protein
MSILREGKTLVAACFLSFAGCGSGASGSDAIVEPSPTDAAISPSTTTDSRAAADAVPNVSDAGPDAALPRLAAARKLISVDWFSPTPDDLVDHLAQRQTLPFDGFAVNLLIKRPSVTWPPTVFTAARFDSKDMQLDKLRQISWGRYTDNFIFVESQDYDDRNAFNWFSDPLWEGINANAALLADAIVASRAKGIVLDIEHYEDPNPWAYNAKMGRTFDEVSAVVLQRAHSWAQNLQRGTSSFTFVVMGLYQMAQSYWPAGTKFENSRYALLKPFADGIISALRPEDKIIDAPEHFYWSTQTLEFSSLAKSTSDSGTALMNTMLQIQQRAQLNVGACLYFDFVWGLKPNPYNWDKGYSTDYKTKWLEHNVYHGLLSSDEYMWFYSEAAELDVFNGKFPKEALTSIENARSRIQRDQPLGFSMSNVANGAPKIDAHNAPKAEWTSIGELRVASYSNNETVKYVTVYKNGQPLPNSYAELPVKETFKFLPAESTRARTTFDVVPGDKLWATGFVGKQLVISNPVTVAP